MLVTCPECSNKVSEDAVRCPKCGFSSPYFFSEEGIRKGAQEFRKGEPCNFICTNHWFSKPNMIVYDIKVTKHKDGCKTGWYYTVYTECPSCKERKISSSCENCDH